MNELAAIKKHLGVSTTESRLNHYTLLGIGPTATAPEIQQALKSAIAAWNRSDKSTDPESAQHVAKLIKQAQGVLLDAVKKRDYDASLVAETSPPSQAHLPNADPFAPFDPSLCLAGAGAQPGAMSFGSIEERWEELSRQIQILNEPAMMPLSQASASPFSVLSQPLTPSPTRQSAAQPATQPASAESVSARIERLKRNRKRKQSLYLATFLIFAIGFLGFAGFLFVRNRLQIAQQDEANAAEKTQGPAMGIPKETAPKTIGGRQAPRGNSNESSFVLPKLSREESSSEPADGTPMAPPLGAEPIKPAEAMKPADATEPTAPAPLPPSPMKPDTPMTPAPEKPVNAMPSAAAKAEWVAIMKKAREAVAKADFKTFGEQMELALPLSTTEEQLAKRARLDQLGQLHGIFIQALEEAKPKLRGTESLTIGKMPASIVEVKENELILRIQGKNERYAWDRLPPGITIAIADMTLNDSNPTDIAARAVYFSLSPTKNDLIEARVKDWFEKSVGRGTIRQDLVQALTDTYE